MNDIDLKNIIEKVLIEMGQGGTPSAGGGAPTIVENISDDGLTDITTTRLQDDFQVPHPHNKDAYMKLKSVTPARLGVWRTGSRFMTNTQIRFRADHAAARDAVLNEVPEEFIEKLGLFEVQSQVANKDEYITRPDLGRKVSDEGVKILNELGTKNAQVQIYLSDGLSSTAVETNGPDTLKAIEQGLDSYGIKYGKPFFLKYGRVDSCDHIGEILGSEVVVVLLGERPGLVTSESMSCYMTYKPYIGIPQAKRTVVSNIHRQGTNAPEAGAHIADIIKKMIDNKASGLDLKL